ncbi:MAG: hypothetical protein K2H19_03335, partial [Ruminococcus sp.]|nr:hypothetical protein [Ruminococcus sp.]
MITNIRKTEFGIEGKLYSKIFNTEIDVIIDDEVSIEYAQKCAEHFNSFNSEIVETICKGAKAYCLDFMEMTEGDFEEDMTIMVTPETPAIEIMKCFKPTVLIVEKPDDENITGYKLECSCDWEIEHGMEIDILDEKVVYLSSFNGYSPWDYEDDE